MVLWSQLPFQPTQVVDTTPKPDSTIVSYFVRSYDSLKLLKTHHIDTALLNFPLFDPLKRDMTLRQTLSNAGLSHQDMQWAPVFHNGFARGHTPYSSYLRNSDNIRYLTPLMPFTEVNYLMGMDKEQQLNARLSRQIRPRFYIGMDYELLNSPGPYKHNLTNISSVYFNTNYRTKNKKYGVLAHYFHNKLVMNENGGIKDDEVFENDLEIDRRVIAVHLVDASNMVKQSGFGLEQEYALIFDRKVKINDTVEENRPLGFGLVSHRMEYERNQGIYRERSPLESFYNPFDMVLDSTQSYDSVYVSTFRNMFRWSNLGIDKADKDRPLYIYAGVETVQTVISDSAWRRNDWQLNPYGGIQISLFRSFFIDGEAKLITGSFAGGDARIHGGVRQFLGTEDRNFGDVFFRAQLINQSPSWFFQRYQSNHFRWENEFVNEHYLSMQAGYHYKGVSLGANWHLIDKYLYMDRYARPAQTSGTFSLMHLFARYHLKLGKFDIIGNAHYQKPENDTLMHLPELAGVLNMSFTSDIFKKAATFQTGINLSWFSSFYADAWMPATRSFYLQYDKKVGDYPYLDVHLALKVKRARIFVQGTNLFGLLGYYSYYTTVHYPMRDPGFYFGVSWRFYK